MIFLENYLLKVDEIMVKNSGDMTICMAEI